MAGAMRKMGVYLGLVEDDEYPQEDRHGAVEDYAEDYREDYKSYDRDYEELPTARSSAHDRSPARAFDRAATLTRDNLALDTRPTAAVVPDPEPTTTAYRITTLHPRTYNEARTIGEHFREGVPVIMNLTELDDSDAKRLVDFAAGLIFGLRGSIERVTNKVFLLSPANVEVTAEDKARIAEGGFFNQS